MKSYMYDPDSLVLLLHEEEAYNHLGIYKGSFAYITSFQFVTQGQEFFEFGDDALFGMKHPKL